MHICSSGMMKYEIGNMEVSDFSVIFRDQERTYFSIRFTVVGSTTTHVLRTTMLGTYGSNFQHIIHKLIINN